MPRCSNSEHDFADVFATTLGDVLDLVTTESPDFDGYLNVRELLRPLEPSLVFLTFRDGETVVLEDRGVATAHDAAGQLANRLEDLAPGETRCLQVESEAGSQLALAVSLSAGTENATLVCLVDPSARAGSPGDREESHTSVMLGALSWVIATGLSEKIKTTARVAQLAASQDAVQGSYAQSLARAVEEREERLQEQMEHASRLQAVMMTAAEGIITVDGRGVIETANAAAADIFGYSPQEVIGTDISILFPPDDDRLAHALRDLRSQSNGCRRSASARELPGLRKNGTTFPLELAISEVALGDRVLLTAILRDITERKKAEQELRQLHLFNRMILDSAGEGVLGLDHEGKVTFVNPIAEQFFGRQSAQMVGMHLHELVHHSKANGATYPWRDCPVHKTLTEGSVHREDGEVFWRENGTSFPVEYVATPMREDGTIMGAVLTFQDISQRKTLEAQLLQAQKLESIGQLAAGIAHEINTPTQFIGDNLRFLSETFRDLGPLLGKLEGTSADDENDTTETGGGLDQDEVQYLLDEVPKAISQSLEGVERVAKIVRSMKEFSHPGSDEMQSIDLNRAIESTLTVCRNEWKYVADVVTDLDPDLPAVTCLPGECNQVFLNLIINASHAIAEARGTGGQDKGTIAVSTRNRGDYVEIRITDTGTGIPEESRTKVFDPFFTTKEVGRGTGQGLAIARSVVVDKHGGTLSFETEVGRGTTFIVRLPHSPQQEGFHR